MVRVLVLGVVVTFGALIAKIFVFNGEPAQSVSADINSEVVKVKPASREIVNSASDTIRGVPKSEKKINLEVASVTRRSSDLPGMLRIAFNANPPRKYIEEGKAYGIAADILRAFAKRYGVDLDFQFCVLKECLELAKAGRADAVLEIARNPEREAFLSYLNPAMSIAVARVFYVRSTDNRPVDKIQDLHGKKVGVLANQSYFNEFDRSKKIKRINFPSIDAMIAALVNEKIDTFIGLEDPTDYRIAKNAAKSFLRKGKYSVRENILVHFMAFGKTSPFRKDKEVIEDILSSMYLNGDVAKIINEVSEKFRVANFSDANKRTL